MMLESILSPPFSTLCKTPADQPIENKQITRLYKLTRLLIIIWPHQTITTPKQTMHTYNKFNRRRRGSENIRILSNLIWPLISKEIWKKVKFSRGKTLTATVMNTIRQICPTNNFSSLKLTRRLSEKVSSTILSLWSVARAKFRNKISKRALISMKSKINCKVWQESFQN